MTEFDHHLILETKLGSLTIGEKDDAIVCVKWNYSISENPHSENRLLEKAAREILEYLNGERQTFNIPTTFIKALRSKSVYGMLSNLSPMVRQSVTAKWLIYSTNRVPQEL